MVEQECVGKKREREPECHDEREQVRAATAIDKPKSRGDRNDNAKDADDRVAQGTGCRLFKGSVDHHDAIDEQSEANDDMKIEDHDGVRSTPWIMRGDCYIQYIGGAKNELNEQRNDRGKGQELEIELAFTHIS